MLVYICIYVYKHVCTYIHIEVYMNIYIYIYVCICMYTYVCMHTYMLIRTYIYIYIYIYVRIHQYVHTCIYVYTYLCMHTRVYMYIHICMYIYISVCICVRVSAVHLGEGNGGHFCGLSVGQGTVCRLVRSSFLDLCSHFCSSSKVCHLRKGVCKWLQAFEAKVSAIHLGAILDYELPWPNRRFCEMGLYGLVPNPVAGGAPQ